MRHSPVVARLARNIPLTALLALAACRTRPATDTPPLAPDDSVAVGYGSQARRDVTGSIASLDGDVARRNSPTSVADMLDGRFAGVEVRRLAGGGVSVRIRGQRSLKADAEPLYVVDGIPQHVGNSGILTDLDPRDIKSIEVLKDAGATAVYGSRGANGVILITTRRPY
jgi:TonB-dependent SusC/RagA subfamily outer membrane receptor